MIEAAPFHRPGQNAQMMAKIMKIAGTDRIAARSKTTVLPETVFIRLPPRNRYGHLAREVRLTAVCVAEVRASVQNQAEDKRRYNNDDPDVPEYRQ